MENLASILECPVCLEVPKGGPISQCDNGHLLCSSCRKKIKECPVCKKKLRINRNLAAEKILESICLPCNFSIHGCPSQLEKDEREKHLKVCEFRDVQCPSLLSHCVKIVSLSKLVEHVSTVHQLTVGSDTGSFRSRNTLKEADFSASHQLFWGPCHFMFLQKHFFGEVSRNSKKKEWTLWVYMTGTPDEALAFDAKIKVSNGKKGSLTFTVPVSSIDMSATDVYESGAHASFPDVIAKRMWKKEEERIDVEFEVEYSGVRRPKKNRSENKSVNLTKCRNSKHGCNVELSPPEMEVHQKECDFRQTKCLNFYCNQFISISKLKEHIQKVHPTTSHIYPLTNTWSGVFNIDEEVNMRPLYWRPHVVDFFEKTFFSMFCRMAGQWCFWIYLLGTPTEAEKFQFLVKMSKETKTKAAFQCSAPVSSVDLSTNDVIKRGAYCGFSDLIIQQILGEKKGRLSYTATVQKVKTQPEKLSAKNKSNSSSNKPKVVKDQVAKKPENNEQKK